MQRIRAILFCLIFAAMPLAAFCDEAAPAAAEHPEGLPSKAVRIGHIGPLPITNSMLVTWIVAIGLIIFAQVAMRRVQAVPSGAQNFWEWIVESL